MKNNVDVTEEYELFFFLCCTMSEKGFAIVRHVCLYAYHVHLELKTNPEQSLIYKEHVISSI